ncbi:hypothetical protein AAW51_0059 [Caldimonas brevitalea]|uniref:Uncharacterized protein n=1 Tax=Caldimonas brevitalea TaxID=413882 RepID=A0A0G3BJN1_9BURK|nr:hypothetical protein AAW51_0059 [Caldimonas brevitalea]
MVAVGQAALRRRTSWVREGAVRVPSARSARALVVAVMLDQGGQRAVRRDLAMGERVASPEAT